MNTDLAFGVAGLLMARSRRLRWLVPAMPFVVAAYKLIKRRRQETEDAPARAVLPADQPPQTEAVKPVRSQPKRSKRRTRA